jgi:hypothetical protein
VPTGGCYQHNGLTLLHTVISPHEAFKPTTKQNLRRRIQGHYRGNASGSTLRKTLGVLLEKTSGFPLRRTGKTERLTLTAPGEKWLNDWMAGNAFVVWMAHPEPWWMEDCLIKTTSCPLNIADNAHHTFNAALRMKRKGMKRKEALANARALPLALEGAPTRVSQ